MELYDQHFWSMEVNPETIFLYNWFKRVDISIRVQKFLLKTFIPITENYLKNYAGVIIPFSSRIRIKIKSYMTNQLDSIQFATFLWCGIIINA